MVMNAAMVVAPSRVFLVELFGRVALVVLVAPLTELLASRFAIWSRREGLGVKCWVPS